MPSTRKAVMPVPLRLLLPFAGWRPTRIVLATGGLVAVTVLALASLSLWRLHAVELAIAHRHLTNLARTLAAHASRTLETVELTLTASLTLAEETVADPRNHEQIERQEQVERMLRSQVLSLPYVVGLAIYDSRGVARFASTADHTVLPPSFAPAAAPIEPKDGAARNLRIAFAAPDARGMVSRLLLSRQVEGPRGDPRVIAVAAFDPAYLAGFYRAIELSDEASIVLSTQDEYAVAVHPWRGEVIGKPLSSRTGSAEPGSSGATRPASIEVHGNLHSAIATLPGYPLVVRVTESEHAVLAGWRRQATTTAGSALLVATLVLSIASLLERYLRRREEMVAQLRESEASLTEAHRIAQLGSWSVERSGAVSCSQEAGRLFGSPPTAMRSLADVVALIIDEDRVLAERSLRALTAGSACDIEFRVRTATGDTRWLRVRADPSGTTDDTRARCTVMDVTEQKRADEARQHLAAIVEWTDDAVLSIAADGRILSWNSGAARMFGHDADVTVGLNVEQVFPDTEAREMRRLVDLVVDGMSIEGFETTRTTKDGHTIDVAITLSPIRDRAGRVLAASAVARNVTTQRQAQTRAQVEHAVMRELAERDDARRSLAQAMRILCERMGWRSAVCWTGSPETSLAITADWRMAPDTSPVPRPSIGKVFSSGEPLWVRDLATAPSDVRAELAAVPGVRSVAVVPLMAGSIPLGVLELRADVGIEPDGAWLQTLRTVGSQIGLFLERRSAEAALRESEARFRSLADLSSDWYWEQDAELRFSAVSAGFSHTGIETAKVLGHRCWDIDAVKISEGTWEAHRRTVAARSAFHDLELIVFAPGADVRYVSMSGEPVFDVSDAFRGYRGIARDITPRKVADARRGMEHAVTYLLAESAPVSTTMPKILETVCNACGWDVGMHWVPGSEQEPRRLRLACTWERGPVPGTRKIPASTGEEVLLTASMPAAQIWRTDEPVWIVDLAQEPGYPRAEKLCELGLRNAFLVPVTLGARVVAVLEFLGREPRRADPELISSAQTIGAQVGLYMERRRAEQALRAGKEYIDHVIASAPTLIATIAPDGTARSVNPAIRDIAVYAPDEIEGRNFWSILNAGESPGEIDSLLQQAARQRVADYRIGITTRSGERRDLSVSIAALLGADGDVLEFVLAGADITDHQLAERCHATEHAVARALSESRSVEEGITAALQSVCRSIDWDCGLYRTADIEAATLEARQYWSVDSAAVHAFVDGLRAPRPLRADGVFARTVGGRAPIYYPRIGDSDYWSRNVALTAGLNSHLSVPVEVGERVLGSLQFFSRLVRRPTDAFLSSMRAIGRQVGNFVERRRAEEAQQQANERLRGIAANVPGIVFEYRLTPDNNATFSYVSERALDLLEETAEDLMRDPQLMFRLVEPRYRRRLLRSMHVSRHTGALWLYETPIRTPSGRVRWVRGQSMPKYLDDGSVVWDGVIVDVTAQKQAEQAIQQMNEQLERRVAERTAELSVAMRELESFAYSVSHDLRAPLRSIDGFSRILAEEYGAQLDPTASDYLARVRTASQRMGELIDDLLSLAQVTRSDLKRVRTDLTAMAKAICNDLQAAAPDRRVDVSVHPGLSCMADPSLMRIALENLLGNAWKFTRRKPHASIEFGALQQGGKTVYYVRDDGAGFDMTHASKLFGAFQRLHSPREFDGTGIGLATVGRIIDRHGGRIWAEAAVDRGATFYFTLTRGRR